jgi:hypothetical protein
MLRGYDYARMSMTLEWACILFDQEIFMPTSHHRLVSLTAGLLIALLAREMRSQHPTQNAAGISFENHQPQSGVKVTEGAL